VKRGRRAATLILLAGGLVGASSTASAQIPASIEFRVPKPPTVAAGDSGAFLSYELHVTNLMNAGVTLTGIEIRDGSDTGRVLLSIPETGLGTVLARPGLTVTPSQRTSLAAAGRAHVFLWVPVDKRTPPAALVHRLSFRRNPPDSAALARADSATRVRLLADTARITLDGAVTRVTASAVRVGAPLRGEWVAANGPSNLSGHRRTALPLNGTVAIAQRFGIDFLQVDENGRTWNGDSTDNKAYYAYGENIYAVGDGLVVQAKDSIPENTPRGPVARAVPINLVTVAGNHIVVDMGQGNFAFYAHIIPGSLRVKVGDRVRRGQVIGLVGNSGNSTEPHLHFHVVDGIAPGTSTLGAEGIPYSIASFEVLARCQLGMAGVRCARSASVPVTDGMPLQNQLVRFPD
jgi:hypothetical protein